MHELKLLKEICHHLPLTSINHQAKGRNTFLAILWKEVMRSLSGVDADPAQNGMIPQQAIHTSATEDYSSGHLQ